MQSFVDRFRYNSKRASLAQDRIKKINRIKKIDKPTNSASHVKISFKTKRPTEVNILEVENLSIGYDFPLLENITFEMKGFEKNLNNLFAESRTLETEIQNNLKGLRYE